MHGTVRVLRIRRKKIDHILSYVLFQDMLEMVFGQSLRNAMSPTMIISEPPLFHPLGFMRSEKQRRQNVSSLVGLGSKERPIHPERRGRCSIQKPS